MNGNPNVALEILHTAGERSGVIFEKRKSVDYFHDVPELEFRRRLIKVFELLEGTTGETGSKRECTGKSTMSRIAKRAIWERSL
jgi:hypothetical protein